MTPERRQPPNTSAALDLLTCPLEGRVLIEASAGTGKTWSICALFVRLLLEKRLEVGKILTLTFTRAAAAELKTRIRARIHEAQIALEAEEDGARERDAFLGPLIDRLQTEGRRREDLALWMKKALFSFDEASILTLHAFCQRVLGDTPFALGEPFAQTFGEEGVTDAALAEVTADFWRERVIFGALSPRFLAALTRRSPSPVSPELLARLARRQLQKPLARALWPEDFVVEPAEEELLAASGQAASLWRAEGENALALLKAAISSGALNRQSYPEKKLPVWQAAWENWVAAGANFHDLDEKHALFSLAADRLAQKTNKGKATPEHPLFAAAERLRDLCLTLRVWQEQESLRLIKEFLDDFPERLAAHKRRARLVDFDDLPLRLFRALSGDGKNELAAALRRQYPVAFVDEFQDTDPLQYGILSAIYGAAEESAALFMVGDPKQAIYSFRQADLPTYFTARQNVLPECRFSLNDNQRSESGVLAGINALFSAHDRPFMREGLSFTSARRGAKPLPRLVDERAPEEGMRGAFYFQALPEEIGKNNADAEEWAARTVAQEICRLLQAARQGKIYLRWDKNDSEPSREDPLRAGRVAVLVRSHQQGKRMRRALEAVGVQAVEHSQENIYASEEAREMERLLLALLWPRDTRRQKAALASAFLGFRAADIARLDENEAEAETQTRNFLLARQAFFERGVLAAMAALDAQYGVSARLLAQERGERRLTNFLHLEELLHQDERAHGGRLPPETLAGRYARKISAAQTGETGEEVAQLRLESDRDLVQILTIHRAKGLEYDVVFCPFLWKKEQLASDAGLPGTLFHDENNAPVIDYRAGADKARAKREEAEEILRLLYVALTRAAHRCVLLYDARDSVTTGRGSLLNWLAAGMGHTPESWLFDEKAPPDAPELRAAWARILSAAEENTPKERCAPSQESPGTSAPPLKTEEPGQPLSARLFPRVLRPAWRTDSFSGLLRGAAWREETQEHDALAAFPPSSSDMDKEEAESGCAEIPPDDILRFPKGARAGDCLHAFFERLDFSAPPGSPQTKAAAEAVLARYRAGLSDSGDPARRVAQLCRMAEDTFATPLVSGDGAFCLGDLSPSAVTREMAFYLPAQRFDARKVGILMEQAGEPLPRIASAPLSGYLKGFIDLVFQHRGRFYVLDWKSNHLGWRAEEYAPEALDAAMRAHGYYLQARLYQLALHRYLEARLPEYDPARHLGGAYYLFVRGARPDWRVAERAAGVCVLPPRLALLRALEDFFPPARPIGE